MMTTLRAALPRVHWIDVTGALRAARLVKSPTELSSIEAAAQSVDAALADLETAAHVEPERVVVGRALGKLADLDAEPHRVLWGAGPRPAPIHALAHGDLQRGFICVMDLTASVNGYRA